MSLIVDRIAQLRRTIQSVVLPPEMNARVTSYLEESERMASDITAQIHIEQLLDYTDWIISLPWNTRTTDTVDIAAAKTILDKNHYGMQGVKDTILEYLSVLKLRKENKDLVEVKDDASISRSDISRRAPILCLIGLVGTGKTTLAKSIAQSMGRKFIRIPFGGLSDPLTLRGQSRVQPDAEVGLIMKSLRYAGTKNPVILLDEIDRVAQDSRGDIMGVLVELLDPEQNKAFTDHYIDYPFDCSEVLFIATANNSTNIATAVIDRLEVIQMPSYTDEEKMTIARSYVLPDLLRASGLTKDALTIDEAVWPKILRPLGYDGGIRSIERTLNGLCRKIARMIVEGKGKSIHITEENLKEYISLY